MTSTLPLEEVVKVVRDQIPAWTKDRFMAPDIEKAVDLLRQGKIWSAVKDFIEGNDEKEEVILKLFRWEWASVWPGGYFCSYLAICSNDVAKKHVFLSK